VIEPNPGARPQRAAQFIAFSIIPAKTNREEITDSKRGKIVEDSSGATWLGADVHDIVNRQTCFNRNFLPGGINFQVTIETKIANDRDFEFGITPGNGLEALGSHVRSGCENALEERVGIAKVGNDHIRANPQQPLAFPFIKTSGAVMGFVAGDGDR
jgi:hypothetical protein